MKKSIVLASGLGLAALSLSLSAQASTCSQTGHWYWPQASAPIKFGGSIGNHEGVQVSYFYDSSDKSQVVQVSRSGFADTKTYEYRSAQGLISVVTVGSAPSRESFAPGEPAYLDTLLRMRDLVGYAGAPERYFWPNGGAAQITPGAIHMVKYLDQLIAAQNNGQLPANCILYRTTFEGTTASCNLTGGPLFTLGAWEAQVQRVWVRKGYRLTLVKDRNFDPQGGYVTFDGDETEAGKPAAAGRFFTVEDSAGRAATSSLCVSKYP